MDWSEKAVAEIELGFRRTQRPKNHRYHDWTSARAVYRFLRMKEPLPIIHRKSQIYRFHQLNRTLNIHDFQVISLLTNHKS